MRKKIEKIKKNIEELNDMILDCQFKIQDMFVANFPQDPEIDKLENQIREYYTRINILEKNINKLREKN